MMITDKEVAKLACPEGRYDVVIADDALPGFRVRVLTGGAKLFLFAYKIGGTTRRVALGAFGEVTAAAARRQAEKLRGEVAAGRDPWAERRDGRAAALVAEAAARRKREADGFTVRRLLEDWDRLHLAQKRESYRRDVKSRLNVHLAKIMDKPAAAVTRADAARVVDRAAQSGGPTTSRRVAGYARTMFGWAVARGAVPSDPFAEVRGAGGDVPRDRVLSGEEVGQIWRAAGTLPPPYGAFVRVLMLTLARREEVARMSWGEVSADLATWTLPQARSKNRRPHVAHFAEPMQAILSAMERGGPDALVFGIVPSGKPITCHSYVKRLLDKAIAVERERAGLPPMAPWVPHDLRRGGVTALAEAGFAPHVADRLLAHTAGTIRGVAAVYQRGEFADERRRALGWWGAYVLRHGEGGAGADNVVALPPRRSASK